MRGDDLPVLVACAWDGKLVGADTMAVARPKADIHALKIERDGMRRQDLIQQRLYPLLYGCLGLLVLGQSNFVGDPADDCGQILATVLHKVGSHIFGLPASQSVLVGGVVQKPDIVFLRVGIGKERIPRTQVGGQVVLERKLETVAEGRHLFLEIWESSLDAELSLCVGFLEGCFADIASRDFGRGIFLHFDGVGERGA